jgi:UDP-N-acetylmuramate--alanine ligase
VTYGRSPQADYRANNVAFGRTEVAFDAACRDRELGRVQLRMIGEHNVLNGLAAIAVADELQVPFASVQEAFSEFEGIQRRFTCLGEVDEITVVDDYGHHPAEIQTTLDGARRAWDKRLVVVFQPHRFTRTRDLGSAFHSAFNQADLVVVMDIYAASEDPIPGVSARALADGIRQKGHRNVTYLPDRPSVLAWLGEHVQPGDMLITMGAGDVWRVGQEFLQARMQSDAGSQDR